MHPISRIQDFNNILVYINQYFTLVYNVAVLIQANAMYHFLCVVYQIQYTGVQKELLY